MTRWTTSHWSLDLLDGTQAGPVRTASYIPFTGPTPTQGVTGQLVHVPAGTTPAPGALAGEIAVVDVPVTVVPLSFFTSLSYPGATSDPHHQENPSSPYKRPYLNGMVPLLDALDAAGAAGVVAVLDFPRAGADGSYFPYDGIFRRVPGLYVDRSTGAALRQQASAGAHARLVLPAQKQTHSRNHLTSSRASIRPCRPSTQRSPTCTPTAARCSRAWMRRATSGSPAEASSPRT